MSLDLPCCWGLGENFWEPSSLRSRGHIQLVPVSQVYREERTHGPVQESHWPHLSWTASFAAPCRIGEQIKNGVSVRLGAVSAHWGVVSLMRAVVTCMEVGIPGTTGVARFALPCMQPQDLIVWRQELKLEFRYTLWRWAPPPWVPMCGSQFPPHWRE